jgi:hypothetical protein
MRVCVFVCVRACALKLDEEEEEEEEELKSTAHNKRGNTLLPDFFVVLLVILILSLIAVFVQLTFIHNCNAVVRERETIES